MPDKLTINPTFFHTIQTRTGLSDTAFIRALGLTPIRYHELTNGSTPTLKELAEIQLAFNLTDGIPMNAVNDEHGDPHPAK